MRNERIEEYIVRKGVFTIPEAQAQLGISYGELRAAIREYEAEESVLFLGDLSFRVPEGDRVRDEQGARLLSTELRSRFSDMNHAHYCVLRLCAHPGKITVGRIVAVVKTSEPLAKNEQDWLIEKGVVAPPEMTVVMSKRMITRALKIFESYKDEPQRSTLSWEDFF